MKIMAACGAAIAIIYVGWLFVTTVQDTSAVVADSASVSQVTGWAGIADLMPLAFMLAIVVFAVFMFMKMVKGQDD